MSSTLGKRQHAVNGGRPRSRSAAGDALSALVVRVFRLAGVLTAEGDALARWQVLAAIEHGPATVARIARALGLARQSVQRVADLLERDGLAVYEDNPEHQRAKLFRLTPAGRSALRTIQAAQRLWAEGLAAPIGEADLRRACRTLDRLLGALARDEKAGEPLTA
jgi:DNA-binding MarR family transcriptional regulator